MTTDESKYESCCATLILLAAIAAIVTAPWWAPKLDAMLEPKTIVVMECAK